jgi:hypothetical protein
LARDQEMVIFTRTFDFLSWLLPMTNNFPRAHRHTFTQRLLGAANAGRLRMGGGSPVLDAANGLRAALGIAVVLCPRQWRGVVGGHDRSDWGVNH